MTVIIDGTNGITYPSTTVQNTAYQTRFKNRLINGDMTIDQRNGGASLTITNTSANTYTLDRWFAYGQQASKFSVQQNAGAVTPPVGFVNYLGVTSLSAYTVGASEVFVTGQLIEGLNVADLGWGTANAKTITLSFWVRSSLTGTFGGALQNSAQNRAYPFSYTISAANTWEYETITIAGDTSGTWLTTNGVGIRLFLGLGVGSTLSGTAGAWGSTAYWSSTGATSVVGTNGATFYITGVQAEIGSAASSFEVVDYGTDLIMCQRYCYVNQASYAYSGFVTGALNSGTELQGVIYYATIMRTAPSFSSSGNFETLTNGTARSTTLAIGGTEISATTCTIKGTLAGGTGGQSGVLRASNDATAKMLFTAEL
jgi:hypothetical protein